MSNQVPSFPPLTWDFPQGPRIQWIGRLLAGRSHFQIVSGVAGPRLIVYPRNAEEVVAVTDLVKMVLSYQAVGMGAGPMGAGPMGGGGGKLKMPRSGRGKLVLLILFILILFLVVSCLALRLFAFWFIDNIMVWWM